MNFLFWPRIGLNSYTNLGLHVVLARFEPAASRTWTPPFLQGPTAKEAAAFHLFSVLSSHWYKVWKWFPTPRPLLHVRASMLRRIHLSQLSASSITRPVSIWAIFTTIEEVVQRPS